jgi:outer membrane protein assembly factor BamA
MVVGLLLCGMRCLAQEGEPASSGKAIIADVIPQGSRQVSNQQIMAYLKTRPGSEYNKEVIQEDVRALYATKQFANIEVVPRDEPDGRVTVYFLIRDMPSKVEKVVYQGAKHLKDDDLAALTNIRKGTPLNPIANKLACHAIVRKYNELGRPFAACELLKGDQPGDTEVIFNITEGPRVCLRSVQLTCADSEWLDYLPVGHLYAEWKIRELFGKGSNIRTLDSDLARLEECFKRFGYLDVRISRELQFMANSHDATVVFHLHKGNRYQIKDIPQPPAVKRTQADIDGDISRMKTCIGLGHTVIFVEPPQAKVGEIIETGTISHGPMINLGSKPAQDK